MKLVEIYRCLCDETRLRILHLLAQGPLCVCHFQSILNTPQVAISKHLAYLRRRGLVTAQRHEQWMIYSLLEPGPKELRLQIECLCDCVGENPVFKNDLRRLKTVRRDCCWIDEIPSSSSRRKTINRLNRSKQRERRRQVSPTFPSSRVFTK
jgi:DNA-binding transcriptional ArsR family regulator